HGPPSRPQEDRERHCRTGRRRMTRGRRNRASRLVTVSNIIPAAALPGGPRGDNISGDKTLCPQARSGLANLPAGGGREKGARNRASGVLIKEAGLSRHTLSAAC